MKHEEKKAAKDKSSILQTSSSQSKDIHSQSVSNRSNPKPVNELTKQLAMKLFQIKKLESAGKPLPDTIYKEVNEITSELQESEPQFIGLMGGCAIQGHDCHLLSPNLEIGEHIRESSPVPEGFENARRLVPSLDSNVVGLMVYGDRVDYLYLDGSTQEVE
jgi:hypothetical protein